MEIKAIARIRSPFKEKFGIPRQSSLASDLRGRIVFEKQFRNAEALRGLEGFSHIWLIWGFSANRETPGKEFQTTVRPPRLGGNDTMGVFATRSPFRPNPIGLSCVRIESIERDSELGPVINVLGADLMDGTPIYDIKPYIKYADSRPEAVCGYVDSLAQRHLEVCVPSSLENRLGSDLIIQLKQVLENDPRPSYQDDPERVYGMRFADMDIHFRVREGVLTVLFPFSGEEN